MMFCGAAATTLMATASGNETPLSINSGIPNNPAANPTAPCTTLLKNRIKLTAAYCVSENGIGEWTLAGDRITIDGGFTNWANRHWALGNRARRANAGRWL